MNPEEMQKTIPVAGDRIFRKIENHIELNMDHVRRSHNDQFGESRLSLQPSSLSRTSNIAKSRTGVYAPQARF